MPICDGPTATKQLREIGCTSHIIGITGNVLAEDVDRTPGWRDEVLAVYLDRAPYFLRRCGPREIPQDDAVMGMQWNRTVCME